MVSVTLSSKSYSVLPSLPSSPVHFFYTRFEEMRWLDALYFSVITLTTIGYVLTGVGIMVGFITKVFDHLQKARLDELEAKQKTPPSDS